MTPEQRSLKRLTALNKISDRLHKKKKYKHVWGITEDIPFMKYCKKCGRDEDGHKI